MRASRPIPGNPWPHDMVLSINCPENLLDLLWIREAWGLRPPGDDLPPQLAETPPPVGPAARAAAPIADWQAAWPELWDACLRHAGTPAEAGVLSRIRQTGLSADERRALLMRLHGPSWRDQFGNDAYTSQRREWMNDDHGIRQHSPRDVERSLLDAVIPAWEAGLTTIVEIPCRGTFTRVIAPHGLVVTAATRVDPERYRQALSAFR